MDKRAGRAKCGVGEVDAEAFEVEDAKGLEDGLGAGVSIEMVVGLGSDGTAVEEASDSFAQGFRGFF